MKQISVSLIEKFHRMLVGEFSWETEAGFLDALKGIRTTGEKAMVGTSCHSIIEGNFVQDQNTGYAMTENDGIKFEFTPDQVEMLQSVIPAYSRPTTHFELPMHGHYKVQGEEIAVSMRLDAFDGIIIHDFKFTFSSPGDFSKWTESLQWRYYLDVTGNEIFMYHVGEVKGFKSISETPNAVLNILKPVPLALYRYPELHTDVVGPLSECIKYLKERDLMKYLKEEVEYLPF